MQMNAILTRDVEAIKPDADQRLRPEGTQAHVERTINEVRQTFETYGVPYNEDTIKAAIAITILNAKAAQEMFLYNHSPRPPHTDTTLGKAVHGSLVTLSILFKAADQYEE